MNSELESYAIIETETVRAEAEADWPPVEPERTESGPYSFQGGIQPEFKDDGLPTPSAPSTMAETGIAESTVEQLILKQLFYKGEALGRDLSNSLGLKYSVIEQLVDVLKRNHLITAKRSMGMGNMSSVFVLSEAGRKSTATSKILPRMHWISFASP